MSNKRYRIHIRTDTAKRTNEIVNFLKKIGCSQYRVLKITKDSNTEIYSGKDLKRKDLDLEID